MDENSVHEVPETMISFIILFRKMLEAIISLLRGEESVYIKNICQFQLDGGGSGKGFGIFAKEEIPENTLVQHVFGLMIPIPKSYEV